MQHQIRHPPGGHSGVFSRPGLTISHRTQFIPRGHTVTTASAGVVRPDLVQQNKNFNWTRVDGVIVPFITRGNVKFVSVKMVESKLLSKFPKINMEDMNNVGPIYSYYINESEAKLLTEINAQCYNYGFGNKPFSTKDLIVSLEDFENFYNRAKQHFAQSTSPVKSSESIVNTAQAVPSSVNSRVEGGWVQINNTVVPYVMRNGVKFVPLSVIKYAAGLLTDVRMDGYRIPCNEQEFTYLNASCQSAGVNFTFSMKTKLIKLELVIRMSHSKVLIHELPTHDPFTHAQYNDGPPGAIPVSQNDTTNQQIKFQQMPPRNPFIQQPPQPLTARQPVPFPPIPATNIPTSKVQIRSQNVHVPRDQQTPSPSISPRVNAAVVMTSKSDSLSSTPSSRPSSAQSRNSVTPPPSPKAIIKSLQFEGKTVSCLMRDGEKDPFALLEALVRLYFPQCSLSDFQSALEQVLNIPVHQLSNEEEAEFIRFYGLRVKSLRCKSIVSFEEFQSYYVQLKYIFKVPTSPQTPPDVALPQQANQAATKVNDKENNNNNSNESQLEQDTSAKQPETEQTSQKRKQSAPMQNRKAKQPCKRLEDTVAMLKMRKEPQSEGAEGELD